MKTRLVPSGIRMELIEILQDLEKRSIIMNSSSKWTFPIVLVEKKDGSLRLCIDYGVLNKHIGLNFYPLPTLCTILQNIARNRFFSTLDMCSGYCQITLEEQSKKKSAFTTPEGLHHFKGTVRAEYKSSEIPQTMVAVPADLSEKSIFCYIDHIMICTETREEHIIVFW